MNSLGTATGHAFPDVPDFYCTVHPTYNSQSNAKNIKMYRTKIDAMYRKPFSFYSFFHKYSNQQDGLGIIYMYMHIVSFFIS